MAGVGRGTSFDCRLSCDCFSKKGLTSLKVVGANDTGLHKEGGLPLFTFNKEAKGGALWHKNSLSSVITIQKAITAMAPGRPGGGKSMRGEGAVDHGNYLNEVLTGVMTLLVSGVVSGGCGGRGGLTQRWQRHDRAITLC